LISIADAQKVTSRSKKLVAPMAWAKKLNHSDPVWYEYRSALEYEDDPTETPEGLMVVCQWKCKDGLKSETWNFGLFFGGGRICGIDSNELQKHTNKVGVGRPYFRRTIHGIHEHTWSEEGYGYVEPLALVPVDGPSVWKAFVAGAGIADPGFVHPDKAINDGQQELGL
jgi:hypothetical protein